MQLSLSSLQGLKQLFRTGFSVDAITEPLISRDQTIAGSEARQFMEEQKLQVIGLRSNGHVIGFVEFNSVGDGSCANYVKPFEDHLVILSSTPFTEVVHGLKHSPRLFVSVFGRIGGIVTRTDLQKPPVRMWLFGMVTLIEMRMTQMIERAFDNGDWHQYLSESRVEKAKDLLKERMRRHQKLGLIDCLQFSDKAQIIARNQGLRSQTRFNSRRQVEDAAKKLERLRNNLAHSQDIISKDWEALVDLSENLDRLLDPPNP